MIKWISIAFIISLAGCTAADNKSETEQAQSTVLTLYDGFAKGDISQVTSVMAENIVWNEADNFPYADRNPYIGADAIVKGVFARVGADWSSFVVRKEKVFSAGDTVVVEGYYDATVAATGDKYEIQVAHIWKVKDGKITHFQQYADTLKVNQALAKSTHSD